MRQGTLVAWIAICTIAVLIGGCGKDGGEKDTSTQGSATSQAASGQTAAGTSTQGQAPAQPPVAAGAASGGIPTAESISQQAEQTRQALVQANGGKEITAVTGDTLKTLLPETLAGMKRVGASAEKNQMMGVDMSHAEGNYESEDGATISLTVTDLGNLSGAMKMGMMGWTMAQYNRETDTGYEKTGTYSGYKGMEEYDREGKSGTIKIAVSDRFIVELTGNDVTMDTLKQALSQIDLKKVAAATSGS